MTIRLDQQDYLRNYEQINLCLGGEMCKIAEEEHAVSGKKRYIISTDVTEGWSGNLDRSEKRFHGWRGTTNDWVRSGLGTFYMIDCKEQKNGRYVLRFTDDLNLDLP